MTIFILGTPEETAKALDNKSLGKIISDIADILRYTCLASIYDPFESGEKEWFRVTALIGDITITREHKLYDWTTWTRTCRANYLELVKYAQACCDEFEYRNNETKILYGRKYIKYENGELKEYEYKLHKHHDVIRWCDLNLPALPSNSTYECLLPDYSSLKAEPWPLVMPEKYIVKHVLLSDKPGQFIEPDSAFVSVIGSYRAYYKAKLRKMACNVNCSQCDEIGMVLDHEDLKQKGSWKMPTRKTCPNCNGKRYITQTPVWTRREKPEWLGDL